LDRHKKFSAQALRLQNCSPCEFRPADTGRKPEVVLNASAHACLASGTVAVEEESLQPFRRTIDRRREARGAGADDHQVVQLKFGVDTQA
jgi:hypothetical protein